MPIDECRFPLIAKKAKVDGIPIEIALENYYIKNRLPMFLPDEYRPLMKKIILKYEHPFVIPEPTVIKHQYDSLIVESATTHKEYTVPVKDEPLIRHITKKWGYDHEVFVDFICLEKLGIDIDHLRRYLSKDHFVIDNYVFGLKVVGDDYSSFWGKQVYDHTGIYFLDPDEKFEPYKTYEHQSCGFYSYPLSNTNAVYKQTKSLMEKMRWILVRYPIEDLVVTDWYNFRGKTMEVIDLDPTLYLETVRIHPLPEKRELPCFNKVVWLD